MKSRLLLGRCAMIVALTLLAACAFDRPSVRATPNYAGLLSAPGRPTADVARDAMRRPAEILAFSKVGKGQVIFELEAGGGYYTELLSRAVGPAGAVTMHFPPCDPVEFETQYRAAVTARLKDRRLPNVKFSETRFDQLAAASASVDVVTWFQGPHELWFRQAAVPNGLGDPVASFADIFRILKPGGYLILMDHAAASGSPVTAGHDLHRIDPAHINSLAVRAGFILDQESALLSQPRDDHTQSAFAPAIRGKTDQFLLRYRKPG